MSSQISAEVVSKEVTGYVDGFGLVSPDHALIMDEIEMRRTGNRFGRRFGEVPLPTGVSVTIVIKDE